MANIKFSPDQVDGIAGDILSKKNEVEGNVNALQNIIINNLCANWDGAAKDKYQSEFEALKKDVMDKFVVMLDDLSTQLKSISTSMREADQQIASKISMR